MLSKPWRYYVLRLPINQGFAVMFGPLRGPVEHAHVARIFNTRAEAETEANERQAAREDVLQLERDERRQA